MIDISYEVKKFKPINIAAIPADEKYGENVRLAFALYNKAIQKIKDGYEDLARIDLKKAIQLFPSFHVAIIMLGMCTFANGDRIGAVRIFNSVKDPEMREKSLNYLDYLANEMDTINNRDIERPEIKEEDMFEFKATASKGRSNFKNFEVIEVEDTIENLKTLKLEPVIKEEIVEEKPAPEPEVKSTTKVKQEVITPKKRIEEPPAKKENSKTHPFIIGYVGCAVVIVVLSLLVLVTKGENRDLQDSLAKYANTTSTVNTPTPTVTVTNTPTLEPTAVPIDHYAETKKLIRECIKHYNFKQYFNVVEIYHTIKMEYVPESDRDNLKKIYELSLSNFTRQNHNSSFSLSSQQKYDEVIEMLLPIQKYNPNYSEIDSVIFYIGKAYEDSKNYVKAKEYYTQIVDKYPNSDYSNWAAYRLKVIG